MKREFDVVLFGATGFTGRVVAHYLSKYSRQGWMLRWAIAGRNASKLAEIRNSIDSPELPIVLADSLDPSSIASMARRTRLIISVAGPFQLFGTEVVAACAAHGTDYVDITGESNWIRDMLVHDEAARSSGARIVFSCGFDSVISVCSISKT